MEDNPEDRRKFFVAAMKGDISFFEEARKKEIENCDEDYFLRQTSTDKYNILHIAIQYGKDEFIKKIVKGELLPRAVTNQLIYQRDDHGNTPLHAAEEEGNIEFLKLLLEYEEGEQEVTVLRPAPVISRLQNNDGNTPLHVALVKRNLDVPELLVKLFPDLTGVTNNEGNTPFHVAAALGNPDIFMLLYAENEHSLETCRLKNKQGNTALHVACINGRIEIARWLLEQDPGLACLTNYSKETPLHLAIIKHQIIGKKNPEDNKKPESSRKLKMELLLEKAVEKGDVDFVKEARSREIENGKYFLGQNESDADNILHIAVKSEKDEFIKKITEERLLPRSIINKLMNQSNKDGDTPLHVAAKVGNVTIFNLLLKYENGQYEIKNANQWRTQPWSCWVT